MDFLTLKKSKDYSDRGKVFIAGTKEYPTVQSALDALPGNGGVVQVLPGVYMESLLVTKPNTHLYGTWDSIIKTPDNAVKGENDSTIRLLAPGCLVEKLKFFGNPKNNINLNTQPEAVTSDGVGIYADDCTVRDCWFVDTMGHSVIVWNDLYKDYVVKSQRKNILIDNNLIEGNGFRAKIDIARDQADLADTNRDVIVSRNKIRNSDQYGVIVHWGTNISIIDNHIHNVMVGIRPHGHIENLIIRGNVIKETSGYGIFLHNSGFPYKNCIVEGNIIENSVGNAIHVGSSSATDTDKVSIKNNIITSSLNPIAIDVAAINADIEGNIVDGGTIQISKDGVGARVINNRVINAKDSGVAIRANNTIIKNNKISDCKSGVRLPYGNNPVNTVIEQNTISNCTRGVNTDTAVEDVIISKNTFDGVFEYVIYMPKNLIGNSKIYKNKGYTSEARGIAVIPSGSTQINVAPQISREGAVLSTEGIVLTKDCVKLTPLNNLGEASKFWVESISRSSLVIRVDKAPGGTGAEIAWAIELFQS